ncbi:hypothetical protein CJ255_21155 [Candidatus Viridilinea mediisalina]|uniref:Uncharacterized protein n=1 Tax=Candidatus Viridilinea mediisalina TaxID=2024553 RepID=A0A2A6RDX5_9CHLR|nr:hypothetical protein CJ255_21155 [Candidatus Viridilinea mediisalina]
MRAWFSWGPLLRPYVAGRRGAAPLGFDKLASASWLRQAGFGKLSHRASGALAELVEANALSAHERNPNDLAGGARAAACRTPKSLPRPTC